MIVVVVVGGGVIGHGGGVGNTGGQLDISTTKIRMSYIRAHELDLLTCRY